jgi:hypothetical protein
MNTFIPTVGASDISIPSAGPRLLMVMGLLAFTACSGVGIEEEALAPAAEGEGVAALEQPLLGSDA